MENVKGCIVEARTHEEENRHRSEDVKMLEGKAGSYKWKRSEGILGVQMGVGKEQHIRVQKRRRRKG